MEWLKKGIRSIPYLKIGLLVIASIIALPAFYILSKKDFNDKFKIKLNSSIPIIDSNLVSAFVDLNGDKYSELVFSGTTITSNSFITAITDQETIGQWNFKGQPSLYFDEFIMGDYDKNGFQEIYIFTIISDSVYLNILEPMSGKGVFVKDLFITTIRWRNNKIDFDVITAGFSDINIDSYDELFFGIMAGYSGQPRNIFRLDIHNLELIKTETFGAMVRRIKLFDMEGDNKPELLLDIGSHCNVEDSIAPFSDYSSWFMVYNCDLKLQFEPVEFSQPYSVIQVVPILWHGSLIYLASYEGNQKSWLHLFDLSGKEIIKNCVDSSESYFNNNSISLFMLNDDRGNSIYLLNKDYKIYRVREDLSLSKYISQNLEGSEIILKDIDNDYVDEFIVHSKDKQYLTIYRNDISHPVNIRLTSRNNMIRIGIKQNGENSPQIVLFEDSICHIYDYSLNSLYPFRLIPYLLIYSISLLLVILLYRLSRKQLIRSIKKEKRLHSLQLVNIINQIDPHLTFNVLNFIGASIMKDERKMAFDQLVLFSRLLKSELLNANKLAHPLKDEVDFTKTYLKLLQNRFPDKFDFSIYCSDDKLDELFVPRMVIHTFSENAVKHGLLSKDVKGELIIEINKGDKYLNITVQDNGIGRKAAAIHSESFTGKGISLMSQLFDYLNNNNSDKATFDISDLYAQNNEPSGTRVTIKIPLRFDYTGIV